VLANQVLAACSAVFSWAVREELLKVNPCVGVERKVPLFWAAFDQADCKRGAESDLVDWAAATPLTPSGDERRNDHRGARSRRDSNRSLHQAEWMGVRA